MRRIVLFAAVFTLLLGVAPTSALAAPSAGNGPPSQSDGVASEEGALTPATNPKPGEVSTNATVSVNPYGCRGKTPSPHPSSNVVRAHDTMTCDIYLSGYVYASLWRSRWYGFEKMAEKSYRNSYARYWDAYADWNPGSNCHYYRNNGRFEVYTPTGTYSLSQYYYDQRYLSGYSEGCGVSW